MCGNVCVRVLQHVKHNIKLYKHNQTKDHIECLLGKQEERGTTAARTSVTQEPLGATGILNQPNHCRQKTQVRKVCHSRRTPGPIRVPCLYDWLFEFLWHFCPWTFHSPDIFFFLSFFQTTVCKPQRWLCVKTTVDHQFLKYSVKPVCHEQPCFVQCHLNHLSSLL